jgi:hypothetical protein
MSSRSCTSDQVFLSGGPEQGLKVGDVLVAETAGETITSGQTGLPITLPGQAVARLEVVSFFGDSPEGQGTIARIVQGQLSAGALDKLRVVEPR